VGMGMAPLPGVGMVGIPRRRKQLLRHRTNLRSHVGVDLLRLRPPLLVPFLMVRTAVAVCDSALARLRQVEEPVQLIGRNAIACARADMVADPLRPAPGKVLAGEFPGACRSGTRSREGS